jgi:hypothetical protein
MGDLGDIVNLATGVMKILDSNETESMGKLATALPRGVDPLATDGSWQRLAPPMSFSLVWKAEHPTFRDDDQITIGLIWTFGGSVGGKGRYIKDAEAYVTVQHTSPTYHYDVSVKFAESGTPIGPEPVAMLTGTLNVRTSRTITGVESTQVFGFTILGDGSGNVKQL